MIEEYAFLQCNGDMFNETQCEPDGRCYCVDTVTGIRLNDVVVMEENRNTLDCKSKLAACSTHMRFVANLCIPISCTKHKLW